MRRGTLFWGIALISVGFLLLVGALFRVNAWNLIWPLFLIALGGWILWGILFGRPSMESMETAQVTIPLEGAGQARLHVRHGAGRLRIDSSASPGELVTGTFGGGLDHRVRRDGDILDVELRVPPHVLPWLTMPWMWGPHAALDWTFGLSREIPLSLYFETGAGDTRMDLTETRVTDLRLQTGASATDLTLPANAGTTQVKVRAGVASVVVRVPSGVAARIRASGGLAEIHVDRDRFPRAGGVYQSADYDTAPNRVDIDVEAGVGSVNIR